MVLEFRDDDVAISVKNLTKAFDNHIILSGLNFDIPKNKITTILGFSGAGKSTLLKHLLGLLRPTSGTVHVLGKNIFEFGPMELREFRRNFGMLFQYAALFDSFTAFENVAFPLREFTDFDEAQITKTVSELLKATGIKDEAFHRLPGQLSGGMRKRVGLARALALGPRIMLYDEPTTGLDPITTKMVNDLIVSTAKYHRERGLTSLIISHDVKASLAISDFVAFLDRGRIVEFLPAKEFIRSTNPLVQEFINL